MFIAAAIFLVAFVIFASITPDALINGDAAVYAQQIANRDFSQRTTHLGYYLLGFIFTYALPLPLDYALNLMNCFFGALSIALIYLMAFTIEKEHIIAIVSSLFLMTNYPFVFNSLYAEVYVAQTFFLILAIQLWIRNKLILSGLSFAYSFLISASTILAFPFFIILRPRIRALFAFCVAALIVVTAGLLPHLDNYLYGPRGLLKAVGISVDMHRAILKEGKDIFFGLFVYIPFLIAGVIRVITEKKLKAFGMAALIQWAILFLVGEKFYDVPVQLPTYALLCLITGVGFDIYKSISPAVGYDRYKYIWLPFGISFLIVSLAALGRKCGLVPAFYQRHLPLDGMLLAFAFTNFMYLIMALLLKRGTILLKKTRLLAVFGMLGLCIVINSFLVLTRITATNDNLIEFRNTIFEMNKVASLDYLVVGEWDNIIRFEHYLFQKSYTDRAIHMDWLFGTTKRTTAINNLQEAIAAGREIWILNDAPTLVSELRRAGYTIHSFRSIFRARRQN